MSMYRDVVRPRASPTPKNIRPLIVRRFSESTVAGEASSQTLAHGMECFPNRAMPEENAVKFAISLSNLIEDSKESKNSASSANSLSEPVVRTHMPEHRIHRNSDLQELNSADASENSRNPKCMGLYKTCEHDSGAGDSPSFGVFACSVTPISAGNPASAAPAPATPCSELNEQKSEHSEPLTNPGANRACTKTSETDGFMKRCQHSLFPASEKHLPARRLPQMRIMLPIERTRPRNAYVVGSPNDDEQNAGDSEDSPANQEPGLSTEPDNLREASRRILERGVFTQEQYLGFNPRMTEPSPSRLTEAASTVKSHGAQGKEQNEQNAVSSSSKREDSPKNQNNMSVNSTASLENIYKGKSDSLAGPSERSVATGTSGKSNNSATTKVMLWRGLITHEQYQECMKEAILGKSNELTLNNSFPVGPALMLAASAVNTQPAPAPTNEQIEPGLEVGLEQNHNSHGEVLATTTQPLGLSDVEHPTSSSSKSMRNLGNTQVCDILLEQIETLSAKLQVSNRQQNELANEPSQSSASISSTMSTPDGELTAEQLEQIPDSELTYEELQQKAQRKIQRRLERLDRKLRRGTLSREELLEIASKSTRSSTSSKNKSNSSSKGSKSISMSEETKDSMSHDQEPQRAMSSTSSGDSEEQSPEIKSDPGMKSKKQEKATTSKSANFVKNACLDLEQSQGSGTDNRLISEAMLTEHQPNTQLSQKDLISRRRRYMVSQTSQYLVRMARAMRHASILWRRAVCPMHLECLLLTQSVSATKRLVEVWQLRRSFPRCLVQTRHLEAIERTRAAIAAKMNRRTTAQKDTE